MSRPVAWICILVVIAVVVAIATDWLTTEASRKPPEHSPGQAQKAIVDEDYRFRLDPVGPGWRLLGPSEATKFHSLALAGAMGPSGIAGIVTAEAAPGARLEELARQWNARRRIEDKKVVSFERIAFKGFPAIRTRVHGTMRGIDIVYEATLFPNGGFLFKVLCVGPRHLVRERTFIPFQRAFHVIPGKVRGRRRTLKTPDTAGVGWRVRNGIFESATFKLAVAPRSGWSLVTGAELDATDPQAEVGLFHTDPRVLVMISAQRAAGVKAGAMVEKLLSPDEDVLADSGAPPIVARVAGHSIRLRSFKSATKPPTRIWQGVLVRGDHFIRLRCRALRSLEAHARRLVPEGLKSIRLLSDDEARVLSQELAGVPDPQNRVGTGYALRHGCYRSFGFGFVWRKPSRGFWRIIMGDDARQQDPDATLIIEAPAQGLHGSLIVGTQDEFDQASYHGAVLRTLIDEEAAARIRPTAIDLGGVAGLTSECALKEGGIEWSYHVTTVVHRERTFQLVFTGTRGNISSARNHVLTAVQGLRFPASRPKIAQKGNRFVDHRMGYAITLPDGPWRRSDETPADMASIGSVFRWRAGERTVQVMAHCYSAGPHEDWMDRLCAGINRHGVGDESSLQERSSNPSWPRVMRRRPRGQSVRRAGPGVEALAGEA